MAKLTIRVPVIDFSVDLLVTLISWTICQRFGPRLAVGMWLHSHLWIPYHFSFSRTNPINMSNLSLMTNCGYIKTIIVSSAITMSPAADLSINKAKRMPNTGRCMSWYTPPALQAQGLQNTTFHIAYLRMRKGVSVRRSAAALHQQLTVVLSSRSRCVRLSTCSNARHKIPWKTPLLHRSIHAFALCHFATSSKNDKISCRSRTDIWVCR